jgi:tRNA A-37 threonylcarbamoyl transferase component Bud32
MAIPEKIGRYIVKSELGRGGMATVYRGFDPSFDREVAIKVLPREMLHDPQFRSRFEREIKMVAALEHPSIVPVYDVGDEDGQPYFVMRYMTGGSLSDLIEKGKIPLEDTAHIVGKIAQGLAYSHRKGIVHRDLKPDNILFDENGNPFISDFGIAKLTESSGGLTGSGVIGTPAYMSPEQAQGSEIDGRSDVYGLGVIVYQMLSGQQPYSADTPMGVVVKHITEPVPEIMKLIPEIPDDMDAIIKTAMAKDKSKRYDTTIELAKALNMVAFGSEGNLTFSTNTNLKKHLGSPTTRPSSGGRTGAFVVVGVLVLAVVGFFLLRNQLLAPDTATATVPVEQPTEALPTATEEVVVEAPTFAPFCSESITFPAPEVKETENRCIQKKGYSFLNIPEGAELEVLHPDGSCRLEAISSGKQTYSCTGTPFLIMDVKACFPPPVIANDDLGKCSEDATFNAENQCCVAIPPQDAGCTVIEIKLKGCQ